MAHNMMAGEMDDMMIGPPSSEPQPTGWTPRVSGSPFIEPYEVAVRGQAVNGQAMIRVQQVKMPETLAQFKQRMCLCTNDTEANFLNRGLTDEDARHLIAIVAEGKVTRLLLAKNELGDATACALARCLEGNTTLTCLGLASNRIGNRGALALADMLTLNHSLRTLYLYDNPVGSEARQFLTDANESRKEPMCDLNGLVL